MAKEFEQFDFKPRDTGRNTVNGVPVDSLDGHLPPPIACNQCGYPVWLLDAPDTSNQANSAMEPLVMVAEWQSWCVDGEHKARVGKYMPEAFAPLCGHPYHLIPHVGPACRQDRTHVPLPPGLIVRPPRVGGINE